MGLNVRINEVENLPVQSKLIEEDKAKSKTVTDTESQKKDKKIPLNEQIEDIIKPPKKQKSTLPIVTTPGTDEEGTDKLPKEQEKDVSFVLIEELDDEESQLTTTEKYKDEVQ